MVNLFLKQITNSKDNFLWRIALFEVNWSYLSKYHGMDHHKWTPLKACAYFNRISPHTCIEYRKLQQCPSECKCTQAFTENCFTKTLNLFSMFTEIRWNQTVIACKILKPDTLLDFNFENCFSIFTLIFTHFLPLQFSLVSFVCDTLMLTTWEGL